MGNDATCGDFAVDSKKRMPLIEKAEVEREAHAKGVHARAAGDEKARANLVALKLSEPKQARTEANRDRNPMA